MEEKNKKKKRPVMNFNADGEQVIKWESPVTASHANQLFFPQLFYNSVFLWMWIVHHQQRPHLTPVAK